MIPSSPTRTVALNLALQAGDVSLREFYRGMQTHFEKIEPEIHAFLPEAERFERLARQAEQLEKRYLKGRQRPALFGLPLGVKDIFHVDGFPTQAGSQLPARVLRGREAESVNRLKAAGALILGKTVTTEFAYFAPGPTRNPHNLAHTPGGSSSGSAAAVAAGLAPLTLGTQTVGSVTRPASYCGVIGYKPSYGRISAEGVIPLSPSLDHVGLFAADLELAQLAASLLVENWRAVSDPVGKPVLAIPTGAYLKQADADIRNRFTEAVEALQRVGYWVKWLDVMPDWDAIVERHNVILDAEAAKVHQTWYADYKPRYHRRTADMIERGQQVSTDQLQRAKKDARRFSLRLSTLMDIHGIDAWIAPSATGAAPKGLDSTGNPGMNLPWTQAGFPSLNLPMGENVAGLPLGFQFIADFNRDETLFQWAAPIAGLLAELP